MGATPARATATATAIAIGDLSASNATAIRRSLAARAQGKTPSPHPHPHPQPHPHPTPPPLFRRAVGSVLFPLCHRVEPAPSWALCVFLSKKNSLTQKEKRRETAPSWRSFQDERPPESPVRREDGRTRFDPRRGHKWATRRTRVFWRSSKSSPAPTQAVTMTRLPRHARRPRPHARLPRPHARRPQQAAPMLQQQAAPMLSQQAAPMLQPSPRR